MIEGMSQPILVTGCARSGASMIAGVFNLCGAFGGVMDRLCENIQIRDKMVSPYLQDIKADTAGQFPLPDVKNLHIPSDWETRVVSYIKDDGYPNGPWMYKGSRMCLMWPVWHYAFPNAKWVIVRRRTGDIIHSCTKTDFMRAFRQEENRKAVGASNELEGWKWWVHQHEKRFVEMITEGINCKVVWPERMVWGDYQQLFETIDWLGLKWTSDVLAYIDPKLWRSRRNGNIREVKPTLSMEG